MTARQPAHRIQSVSYQENVLVCSCGAIMPAKGGAAWASHRRAVGARSVTISQTLGKRAWLRDG